MKEFLFLAEKGSMSVTQIPGLQGMREFRFYTWGASLPFGVPHGCNPRDQDIHKPVYERVAESYRDKDAMYFHLKNHGITVLSDGVAMEQAPQGYENIYIQLRVQIPDHLGNVDGHHSYEVVKANCASNPNQMVRVTILDKLPQHLISPVARGLNTAMQVSTASLGDQLGYFDIVKFYLQGKSYYPWIGWKDNTQNVTTNARTIMSLMWVCHPGLFNDASEKHPNWILTRGTAVFEGGFLSEKKEPLRNQMLQMAQILPDLIEIYMRLNQAIPAMAPKRGRKSRSPLEAADGRQSEANIGSLCIKTKTLPFQDPDFNKGKPVSRLRDQYLMLFMSGLRSMIRLNPTSGLMEWSVPIDRVNSIIDATAKPIFNGILKQFKYDKKDHNTTPKNPALWDAVVEKMTTALNSTKP